MADEKPEPQPLFKILNVEKTVAAGQEEDFTFTVPPGGDADLISATFHLKRSAVLDAAITTIDRFTSEDIKIKSLEVTKFGASERTNLLSGTPNIKEFSGNGKLTRLFEVIERLENNEDIIIKVRNDDSDSVRVSITLNLAVFTKVRQIAARPAQVIQPVERGHRAQRP